MYYQALVNKKYKYREEMFSDRILVSSYNVDEEEVLIEQKTYEAYLKLQKFLEQEKGILIGILSCYRSLEEQKQVYNQISSSYGEDYAKKVVAPVGGSEHHTGLCVDLSIYKNNKFLIDHEEIMAEVSVYQQIVPFLSQFGFILRYPKGKEEITGYSYEPWHIRYVGVKLAKTLYEDSTTLEEYYQNLSGVLVINKEQDMTSRDVVNIVSKYFYTKKVGHTGTLDPLATGVLVVTIGKATRISELLMATYKEYIAEVKLGVSTDTLDITGKVLQEEKVDGSFPIYDILEQFPKNYLQEVPIYSAVKVDGKKLYEYARENKEVTLPKKEVHILELELLDQKKDSFSFRTIVSKGTYIRSLIRDIGKKLQTPTTMMALKRTKQGAFSIEQACLLDDVKKGRAGLLSLTEALSNYPQIVLEEEMERKVKNGQRLANSWGIEGICTILDSNHCLLAVYEGIGPELIAKKVLTVD